MSCGQCQVHLQANRVFCANCGQRLANLAKAPPCPGCGAHQLPGSRFCAVCSAPLDRPNPTSARTASLAAIAQTPTTPSQSQFPMRPSGASKSYPRRVIALVIVIAGLSVFRGRIFEALSFHVGPPRPAIVPSPIGEIGPGAVKWTLPLDPSGFSGTLPPRAPPIGLLSSATISGIETHQNARGQYGQTGIAITARVVPGAAFDGRLVFYFRLSTGEVLKTDDPEDQTPDHQLAISAPVSPRGAEAVPVSVFVPYSALSRVHDSRSLNIRPSLFTSDDQEICRGPITRLEVNFSVGR